MEGQFKASAVTTMGFVIFVPLFDLAFMLHRATML